MKTIILTLCLVAYTQCTLELVVEVFRHGARGPYADHPEYGFQPEFETGLGQLTPTGERQHYLLGAKRRRTYIDEYGFLGDNFDPKELYAISTDVNRTIMSAHAHVMGIYPLQTGPTMQADKVREGLLPFQNQINLDITDTALKYGHQPIPIHVNSPHGGIARSFSSKT